MTTQQESDRPERPLGAIQLGQLGDRLGRQIAAMTAWNLQVEVDHCTRLSARLNGGGTPTTRGRLSAQRRTQRAVVEQASRACDDTVDLFMRGQPLALVVHPSAWMRAQLADGLTELGIEVVASCPDGAEALGIAIVEQPDVVVLDDRIASSTGLELLADLLRWSTALVAAQVGDELVMGAMLDGGASAVFSRRVPPAVMTEALSALVQGRASVPVQVR